VRNMSFALTTEQIRARTKTVTRRLGWTFLKPGDQVRAVKKCMGLKKGEKLEPLAVLRVVDVRREPIRRLVDEMIPYGLREVEREGFPDASPPWFVEFFISGHRGCTWESDVTRIEFTYEEPPCP
jgi:hypothetical protein